MALLLKNLLFTFVVPGTVAVLVPHWIAGGGEPAWGGRWIPGALLLALGAAIYAWCVWDFATFGRGTPAPIDAPKRLVVRGLYRWTRNPMYVGVLCVIFGWAALYGAPRIAAYGAAVWLLFHLFVRLYEEPTLRGTFPGEYEEYCGRVGRWLPRW